MSLDDRTEEAEQAEMDRLGREIAKLARAITELRGKRKVLANRVRMRGYRKVRPA